MNILRWLITFSLGLILSSCLLPGEKGKVSLNLSSSDQATRDSAKKSHASVNEVKLIDDELIVKGSDLDGVVKAKVSQNGSDSSLSIISQTANELILSSSSKVALALNMLMSLTLEDAYGATVVEVTFNLPDSSVSTDKIGDAQVTTAKIADGAITAVKLDQMSASVGQLLRWNGSAWAATDLDALTYAGTWDASVGGNPNPAAVGGEYYIVSADGTADPGDGNSRTWAQGDWIVFNDNTSTWDQVSNSSDVTSFEGRTGGVTAQAGDYTWAMINKTTSSIGDIADVDLSTPATTGKVLKFDGTSWIADDDLSGGGVGSVSSSEIADGSIVDADVAGSAAIAWSKINKTGAAASDVGLGNVTNDAQIKAADLDDATTLGTSATKVPSQNAVKTYVDNAVTGMGSVTSITGGAALTDGPFTTTGTIDVRVDDTTIEVSSDALQVKGLGIGTSQLAGNAVTTAKINNSAVTNAKINDVSDTKITTACSDGQLLSASSGNFVCANASTLGNWTLSGTDIYYNVGNVGIGTATPSYPLEVNGNAKISDLYIYNNEINTLNGAPVVIGERRMADLGSSNRAQLRVMTAVGVNVPNATPLEGELHINGNGGASVNDALVIGSAGNGGSGRGQAILMKQPDGTGNGTDVTRLSAVDNGLTIQTGPSGVLTDRLRVSAKGYLGIGEISPTSNLDIKGNLSKLLSGTVDVTSGTAAVTGTGTSFDTELNVGEAIGIEGENFTVSAIGSGTDLTLSSNHIAGASSAVVTKDTDLFSVKKGNGSQSFIIKPNGNVGIGTNLPTGKLEINSDLFNDHLKILRSGSGSFFSQSGSSAEWGALGSTNTYNIGGNSNFTINEGDVGIGVANPTSKLDVNGVITATGFSGPLTSSSVAASAGTVGAPSYSFSSDSNTGFYSGSADTIEVSVGGTNIFDMSSVGLVSATTGGASVSSANGTATVPTFSFAGDEDTGWFSPASNQLAATTAGTERIRIDSTGNIAIGTTSTSAHLEVNGSGDQFIEIENTDAISSSMITFKNTTDTWNTGLKLHTIYTAVDTLGFSIDDGITSRFFIDNSGNIGLGYTKPTANLHFSHERRDEADTLDDLGEYKINLGCSIQQNECKNVSRAAGFSVKDATSDSRFTTLTYHGYAHEFFATPAATYPTLLIDSNAYLESGNTAISIRGHSTESDEFALKVKNSLSNPLLSVLNSGSIGIGTNSPSGFLTGTGTNRLHLKSSNGSAEVNIEHTGSSIGHKSGVSFSSSGNQVGFIRTEKSATSAHDANLAIGTSDGTTLSEKMRITQSGNVGIGTTDPSQKLTIDGGKIKFLNTSGEAGGIGVDEVTGDIKIYRNALSNDTAGITIEDVTGDVGIGTDSPTSKFHVSGTGTTGTWGTYDPTEGYVRIGESNDGINLGIDGNSIVGDSSINIVTTTANPIVFGTNNTAHMRITSDGKIGIGTTSPEKQLHLKGDGYILLENSGGTQAQLNLGNSGSQLAIGGVTGTATSVNIDVLTGNTGIGIGSASQKLDVGGNIAVSGSTIHTSDRRLKRNIASLDNALEKVTSLEGVTYNWKDKDRDQHRQIGVIAQDVKKVFPEAVYENKNTGFLSVNYSGLIGALIESIKELFSMDKEQNRKIAALEVNNEVLREENLKIQKENDQIQHENQQMKSFLCEQYPSADFCP